MMWLFCAYIQSIKKAVDKSKMMWYYIITARAMATATDGARNSTISTSWEGDLLTGIFYAPTTSKDSPSISYIDGDSIQCTASKAIINS